MPNTDSDLDYPVPSPLRLDVIVRSLQARLGEDIDAAIIAVEVEKEIATYSSARVTQFVSILVESRVRERLRRQSSATNEQGALGADPHRRAS